MYNVLVAVQCIGIFVFLAVLTFVMTQRPTRDQELLFIFSASGIVNSIGYLFEMLCTNREMALMAVKFTYVGKAFIPISMLLFTLDYCRISMPKLLERILFIIHALIATMVLTCEYHGLYYSSIDYTNEGLFPHLVLGHGPAYYFYVALMIAYMIIMPTACILRYRKIHNKYDRRQLLLLMLIVIVPFIGFMVFLAGITKGYDTTAICYVISSLVFAQLIVHNDLLRTIDIAKDDVMENLSDSVIVLDNDNDLLFANNPAKELIPGLKHKRISKEDLHQLSDWNNERKPFLHSGRYYRAKSRAIYDHGKLRGQIYHITDVTDAFKYTNGLEDEVNEKTRRISQIQRSIIGSLASMIAARDDTTGNHVKRTSTYVGLVAEALKKNPAFPTLQNDSIIEDIIAAAPLHDIGKISIPDAILNKPGKLTNEEYEIIKTHSTIGGHMIETALDGVESERYLTIAKDIAYYHHERWDGKGYPKGLKGNEIPISARIMSVCDVYDALISVRSYKEPMPPEEVYKIILEGAGTQFDPDVVKAFCEQFDEIKKCP